MNNQQRRDLATRSVIGDSIINLLRRSKGLNLLTYSQGLDERTARVPSTDNGNMTSEAVRHGFEFSGIAPDASLIFKKLKGLLYPLSGVGGYFNHKLATYSR